MFLFYFYNSIAVSKASSIISLNEFCLSSDVVSSLVSKLSEMVKIHAAFFSCFMEKNEYIGWKESLVEKYGLENALLIIEKKVKIGMSDTMCLESWGEPDSKNRTVLNGVETEQWVYKTKSYLYFDNGILTAIQN